MPEGDAQEAAVRNVVNGAGRGPAAEGDRAVLASRTNSPKPDEYARWVLIRRSVSDPSAVAYFACGGPPARTLNELVPVAGARWAVEDLFELAKGDGGLDQYELRSWLGWHRHVPLRLVARAVVAVIRSRTAQSVKKGRSGSRRACPRCASYSCGWCGTTGPRSSRCGRGRRGGASTRTGRGAATTADEAHDHQINYGCRTTTGPRLEPIPAVPTQ